LIPAGTGFRGDLEVSDGPIEEYEGVILKPRKPEAPVSEEEEALAEQEVEEGAGAKAVSAAAPATEG